MKCLFVLSVLALAALGAPGPQSAGCPLPFADYVWLDSLSGPLDTVYTDTALMLFGAAMLHASQSSPGTRVEIGSWDPYGFLQEIATYDLAAGESVRVDWGIGFGPYYGEPAYCVVRESIMDNLPTDSSVVTWRFWILRQSGGGVEDGHEPAAVYEGPLPTVIRCLPHGAVAFDAMGRQTRDPKPGIYFVRTAAAARPRKVLLVE
jgi:hypothetical protein